MPKKDITERIDEFLAESRGDLSAAKRKLEKAVEAIEGRTRDRKVVELLDDAYTAIDASGGPQKVLDLVDDAIEQTERGGDEALMLIDDALYHLDKVVESTSIGESTNVVDGLPDLPDGMSDERDAEQAIEFFKSLGNETSADRVYQAASQLRRNFETVADELGAADRFGPSVNGTVIDNIGTGFAKITRSMQKHVDGYDDRAWDDWTADVLDDLERYRR